MMPIVSKMYCSPSEVILLVRRRPNVANGGGFVVTDFSQRVIFRIDGCKVIGKKGELLLRDIQGNDLLLIRKKGAMVEALSLATQWKSYSYNFLGSHKLVFTLREPNSCFSNNIPIRICVEDRESCNFEIRGNFQERSCVIVTSKGDIVAEIGVKKEMMQIMTSMDLYHVEIKAGIDQAFVFGVIAVLDYIYDGSTRC